MQISWVYEAATSKKKPNPVSKIASGNHYRLLLANEGKQFC